MTKTYKREQRTENPCVGGSGLDHLYREAGVYNNNIKKWPMPQDLYVWLQTAKLRGRAAQWKMSTERALLAMNFGEFGAVLNTQDNSHIIEVLDHDVVMEMDGLSSDSDRTMFSSVLTLYLYRYRLAKGYQKELTNMIFLEEVHNLLHKKTSGSKESVLETSIRMIREYGIGYVFIDQLPSLLSDVAFANSYATIALNQKLSKDIRAMSGAMNLSEEQRNAMNTLPIGTAVIKLADEHAEPFLVKVPFCPIQEDPVSDLVLRGLWESYHGNSSVNNSAATNQQVIPAVPVADKNKNENIIKNVNDKSHPPSPIEGTINKNNIPPHANPPYEHISSEAKDFLHDIISQPLSTTVVRYHRLHLSRRRGDAIRRFLIANHLIEPVRIATRTGQVVLYQLTDTGMFICNDLGLNPAAKQQESLEHRYWVKQSADYYENKGYAVSLDYAVKGKGIMDIMAEKPGHKIIVEVETGKSDTLKNLQNAVKSKVDRLVFVATNPQAVSVCKKVIESEKQEMEIELLTWLDIS